MAESPYTNDYYDKSDRYARGQYDGYQFIVNRYLYAVSPEYRKGVQDGQAKRKQTAEVDIS